MLYFYHVNTFAYHELKDQLTVGRTHGDLIFANDGRMSGRHAQVTVDRSGPQVAIVLEDLGSKNLTVVNRIQIPHNKKIRIKMNSLMEIGSQQFIVTENKTMTLETLNEIMDQHMSKAIVKLDKGTALGTIQPSEDPLVIQERLLDQAEKELATYEQNTQIEMVRIDQSKDRMLLALKAKRAEMSKKIETMKQNVFEEKKFKAESANKLKKIINIKDMGD